MRVGGSGVRSPVGSGPTQLMSDREGSTDDPTQTPPHQGGDGFDAAEAIEAIYGPASAPPPPARGNGNNNENGTGAPPPLVALDGGGDGPPSAPAPRPKIKWLRLAALLAGLALLA